MKSRAVSVGQISRLCGQGFFGPGDELMPMILGLFSGNFDHLEFGTVGQEVAHEDFTEKYFRKRVSSGNKWRQVDRAEVAGSKFGQPFNSAMCLGNVLV